MEKLLQVTVDVKHVAGESRVEHVAGEIKC